jgi:hypothetical protein
MTSLGRRVIVVIFIGIFVGFICLLVFFNSKSVTSSKPHLEDGNVTHTDWLLDLSSTPNDCPSCSQTTTIKHLFCDTERNVFIFRVTDLSDSSNDSDREDVLTAYQVSRISELKQFPDVRNTSLEKNIVYSRAGVQCEQKLEKGVEYLVTAKLEDLSEEITKNRKVRSFVISFCDVVIDWSSLSMPEKHAYFNFFTPLRCSI